ncbi:MAG TPA: hydroxymethylbilane synthase [Ilumatobacter sp.]
MAVSKIRIATRGSAQAVTQARHVADLLAATGAEAELVLIDTHGDRTQAAGVPLHTIGGQGVFVKEVQMAVLDGRADVAVHSAKDLPTTPQDGLVLGAFTERRTAADALIGRSLVDLPGGATVATGSVRRRAQLGRARPDLRFVELRGNIETRLAKVPEGGAIVMAVAALEVLGLTRHIAEVLDPAEFVPAVGQGCVAVECRDGDRRLIEALAGIDHHLTRFEVTVERAFLAELGSGCSLPVGAHVDARRLYAFLADDRTGLTASDTHELSGDLVADVSFAGQVARATHRHISGG